MTTNSENPAGSPAARECPFCGNKPCCTHTLDEGVYVRCVNLSCEATGPVRETGPDAVAAWNADRAQRALEVERLQKQCEHLMAECKARGEETLALRERLEMSEASATFAHERSAGLTLDLDRERARAEAAEGRLADTCERLRKLFVNAPDICGAKKYVPARDVEAVVDDLLAAGHWRAAPRPMGALRGCAEVAKLFHETYERLAPSYGWKTQPASAVPWNDLPAANRELMVHVVHVVLGLCDERASAERAAQKQEPGECRCGSGMHPRRCAVHPERYKQHCDEISAESLAEQEPGEGPRCHRLCGNSTVSDGCLIDEGLPCYGDDDRPTCYCTEACRDAGKPLRPVVEAGPSEACQHPNPRYLDNGGEHAPEFWFCDACQKPVDPPSRKPAPHQIWPAVVGGPNEATKAGASTASGLDTATTPNQPGGLTAGETALSRAAQPVGREEPLPCPFCGGGIDEVRVAAMGNQPGDQCDALVFCGDGCGAEGPPARGGDAFEAKRNAVAAWNKRTPEPPPPVGAPGTRELLARLLKFTEYVCDIHNEMDIVETEDEEAEGGVLEACRAFLASAPQPQRDWAAEAVAMMRKVKCCRYPQNPAAPCEWCLFLAAYDSAHPIGRPSGGTGR